MCGDDIVVEIPVPIPNTEVKHYRAEGSIIVRIGHCHAKTENSMVSMEFFYCVKFI